MPESYPAGVAKLADARDSKSRGPQGSCRFDPDLRHQGARDATQPRRVHPARSHPAIFLFTARRSGSIGTSQLRNAALRLGERKGGTMRTLHSDRFAGTRTAWLGLSL